MVLKVPKVSPYTGIGPWMALPSPLSEFPNKRSELFSLNIGMVQAHQMENSQQFGSWELRGPAAVLLTSRHAASDRTSKLFRAVFPRRVSRKHHAMCCRMGHRSEVSLYMKIRKRAAYCFESTVSEEENSVSSAANSASSAKNSVSSFWHTNSRPRGTH